MGQQLSLSLELILLLDWFLKQGNEKLHCLIQEAVTTKLAADFESIDDDDYLEKIEQLHDTVIKFILFLEDSLLDGLEENFETKKLDARTVELCLQRARSDKTGNQELFKRLLKNWRPASNEPVN